MKIKALLVVGSSLVGVSLMVGCELPNLPAPRNDCVPGTMRVCHTYRDQWGRIRNECRDVYDQCATRRGGHGHGRPGGNRPYFQLESMSIDEAIALNSSDEISAPTEDIGSYLISPARFASRFNLSVDSATRVVEALRDLNDNHNTAKLLAVGFAESDLANMAKMELPSDSCIDAVSKNLDQDPLFTKGMLSMIRLWAAYEIQQKNSVVTAE